METKEQLVQQIKGWMANDNEMRELQSRLKELKEKPTIINQHQHGVFTLMTVN